MNRSITRFALCLIAFLVGAIVALASEPPNRSVKQIDFYSLTAKTQLKLYTESQIIALEIIRPAEGRAIARLSADGKSFGDPQEFILLGATKGQQQGSLSLVEMGVIRTGQKLELGLSNLQASNRLHTLQINRIEISEYR
ncbi:MAG: hypothetical protein CMJ76_05930 [Planctomycetaceae bacterium]|nr:hypothetical protein [Planctomycetaceae bacterium]|tara:strand:- start:1994 stop:2413 length:420 start_codon:yes stop_codon:yes gene_type:complete